MNKAVAVVGTVVVAVISVTFFAIQFQSSQKNGGDLVSKCKAGRSIASDCLNKSAVTIEDKHKKDVKSIFEMLKSLNPETQARVMHRVENMLAESIFRQMQGTSIAHVEQLNAIRKAYNLPAAFKPDLFKGTFADALKGKFQTAQPSAGSMRIPVSGHLIGKFGANSQFQWQFSPSTKATLGVPVIQIADMVRTNPFAANGNQANIAVKNSAGVQSKVYSAVGLNFAAAAQPNRLVQSAQQKVAQNKSFFSMGLPQGATFNKRPASARDFRVKR